ncbi:MAG: hydrogenase maturation protease [Acidimicrobiales bacterium]
MTPVGRAPIVVIGIGNEMRSDDGVGPVAVERLAASDLGDDVELLSLDGEPTRLIDAWRERRFGVVVDAIAGGAEPGTIHRVEVGVDAMPGWSSGPSSHLGGVAEAVAFAEVLMRSADRLIVYGIEPLTVAEGIGLSPAVAASVPTLVARIRSEVAAASDATKGCPTDRSGQCSSTGSMASPSAGGVMRP